MPLIFKRVFDLKEYKTVEFESSGEFIEKKSRFIGYVKPVKTQEEAVDFINTIRSRHWDATHNVYAYVLRDNNIQRYSDDGEPSGTAGVPVLDVILKNELVDVCVVVTRYFGGTLLGTGGLVRAYSQGSKIALEAGGIIKMAPCAVLRVDVDYSFYSALSRLLDSFSANIESSDFGEKVSVIFSVKESLLEELSHELTELSNGLYSLEKINEKYAKV